MVSILMPARNAAKTVVGAINSVLAADHVNEVIVINDGSSDNTEMLVREINDPRIRVIQGPQAGISAALNAGLEEVTERYVARCDADDYFTFDRFSWQLPFLDAHPDYTAISGGFKTVDEKGDSIAEMAMDTSGDVTELLQNGKTVTHLGTWLIRADALRKIGGARTWFTSAEDLDLQFRLAHLGKVWHEPQFAYLYTLHQASITHSMPDTQRTFFDLQAREFSLQRKETGSDDLERGQAPSVPKKDKSVNSANHHISRLLEGQAWRTFARRQRFSALKLSVRAINHNPTNVRLWKGLLLLCVKPFPSPQASA